jgi:pheromone shutdown-related protein TraB
MQPSDTVTVIEHDGRTFYLVGTAHVSAQSVEEVQSVIDEVRPDTVCVELCETRYIALTDEDRWKKLDIFKVIREGKTLLLLANLAVGAYQRRIGKQLGVTPGAELLAGVKQAEAIGARVELIDREIQTTLKRTWGSISFWRKATLLSAIVHSLITNEEVSAEDIENLKKRGQFGDMMRDFAEAMPEVALPLIDERDRYMAQMARQSPGDTVVVVVGAAHVPGIQRYFGEDIELERLEVLPRPSPWFAALKWVVPVALVCAFAYGYQTGEERTLEEMVFAWILPNSLMAALFTAIAGGRPLSVLTSTFSSPITSLNPLIGTAIIVGPVEAWLRKPTVADCERINEDVQSLRGIYRNPFTRVLLVAVMSSLGSALGAWIGITWVLTVVSN